MLALPVKLQELPKWFSNCAVSFLARQEIHGVDDNAVDVAPRSLSRKATYMHGHVHCLGK